MVRIFATGLLASVLICSMVLTAPTAPASPNATTPQPLAGVTLTPFTQATLSDVKEVPPVGSLNGYLVSQAPVLSEAFCVENPGFLAIFKLSNSAITTTDAVSGGGAVGDVSWTTLHADEYDWGTLDPAHAYFGFIAERNATAALVIGELKGTCGIAPTIGLAFDVNDEAGQRLHYLIPLAIAPAVVIDTARLVPGVSVAGLRMAVSGPCSGGTFCDDTYRQRMKTALSAFTKCMKDHVQPVSIWNAACFIGCIPFLAGSPIAYALCALACNSVVSGPALIDLNTCSQELEAEKANAKASYCGCLQYQQQNCPQLAEPENPANGGCP
ncbi:MAG: hypothetical protein K2X32_12655 [Phycisphaerales bacterium]|nr:hypothetical protein [Phycisphaerales bacterium]